MNFEEHQTLDERLQRQNLTDAKSTKRAVVTKKISVLIEALSNQLRNEGTLDLRVSSRSKNNLLKENQVYVLNLEGKKTLKTIKTKGGALSILKILKILSYILEQYEKDYRSTVRELYYNSLNWIPEARFETVNDSNRVLEDIQILLNSIRQDFNILAESDGVILGPLKVEVTTRDGKTRVVDCQKDVPSSGFLLPRCFEEMRIVEHERCKSVLVLETRGCFARLVQSNKDREWGCLICSSGGQPSRCLRRMLRYLSTKCNKPVFVLNDGDAWGFLIYLAIKTGSVKSAHINHRLCTPSATLLGLLPSQIEEYGLPVDSVTPAQSKILTQLLEDPRVAPELRAEVELMISTGVKAEQQSASYHGLSFFGQYFVPLLMKNYGAPGMEQVHPVMEQNIKNKIKKGKSPRVKSGGSE